MRVPVSNTRRDGAHRLSKARVSAVVVTYTFISFASCAPACRKTEKETGDQQCPFVGRAAVANEAMFPLKASASSNLNTTDKEA